MSWFERFWWGDNPVISPQVNAHLFYFLAQFREEEGRLVYRHKMRGAPIVVSPEERDAALRRFRIGFFWMNAIVVTAMFLAITMIVILSVKAPDWAVPAGALALASSVLLACAADRQCRAWAIAPFARRTPVGEGMGWLGAKIMQAEKYDWGTVATWYLILPVLLFTAFFTGDALVVSLPPASHRIAINALRGIALVSTGSVLGFTLLKAMLAVRTRQRRRIASHLDERLASLRDRG